MNERRDNPNARLATVRDHIDAAIKAAVSEHDLEKESLLLAVYDAVSLKPGMLGVSVDLKRLLEHFIPNVREKLRGRPIQRDAIKLLRPFVTSSGCARPVPFAQAEALLGRPTLDALIASSILFHASEDNVLITHDLIARFIHSPKRLSDEGVA